VEQVEQVEHVEQLEQVEQELNVFRAARFENIYQPNFVNK